jgi:hypothetical protein
MDAYHCAYRKETVTAQWIAINSSEKRLLPAAGLTENRRILVV